MWNGYMTNTGISMMNRLASGGRKLTIVRAEVGDARLPLADVRNAASLANVVAGAALDSVESVLNGTNIGVRISAAEVESYIAVEIGIYARLDSGETQLFAVYQEDTVGVSIPSRSVNPNFNLTIFAFLSVMNDDNLIVMTDSGLFVTKAQLNQAREEDSVGMYIDSDGYLCNKTVSG